ncbi:MAG: hypothetical protein IJM44_08035 [Ruminococcus sp.]|nr:hypothetical protein [Ruminococcus sp.]
MELTDIIAIAGLILLIVILVLLVKREKKGKQDSMKLTVWQAVLLTAASAAFVVMLYRALSYIIDKIFSWTPI